MKKFLKYVFVWFVVLILIFEVTLRVFGLSAKTSPTYNIDGNYMLKPGDSGYWVRGGLAEINNYYQVNEQGFNSIVDYDELNKHNLNIAILGDSYIEGFQTDVRYSIGRQLEDILGSKSVVHEFGRSGANITDYSLAYEEFIKDKGYDFVFVLVTDKDLMSNTPSFVGKGNRVAKKTISRTIYDNVHILRYLNINHGLGVHFNKLINNGPESIARIHNKDTNTVLTEELYLSKINKKALSSIPNSVIFLHEDDRLNQYFIQNFDFKFKKIKHEKLPKDHGFDGHWNKNGRFNCAKAMAEYINSYIDSN